MQEATEASGMTSWRDWRPARVWYLLPLTLGCLSLLTGLLDVWLDAVVLKRACAYSAAAAACTAILIWTRRAINGPDQS